MTLSIADFLLARIAEDETAVKGHAFTVTEWDTGVSKCTHPSHRGGYTPTCWRAEVSAKVLAECAAKRALIDLHEPYETEVLTADDEENVTLCRECTNHAPCDTLRHVATVYADHPDYNPAWESA